MMEMLTRKAPLLNQQIPNAQTTDGRIRVPIHPFAPQPGVDDAFRVDANGCPPQQVRADLAVPPAGSHTHRHQPIESQTQIGPGGDKRNWAQIAIPTHGHVQTHGPAVRTGRPSRYPLAKLPLFAGILTTMDILGTSACRTHSGVQDAGFSRPHFRSIESRLVILRWCDSRPV
jgi:hypothetical protein